MSSSFTLERAGFCVSLNFGSVLQYHAYFCYGYSRNFLFLNPKKIAIKIILYSMKLAYFKAKNSCPLLSSKTSTNFTIRHYRNVQKQQIGKGMHALKLKIHLWSESEVNEEDSSELGYDSNLKLSLRAKTEKFTEIALSNQL